MATKAEPITPELLVRISSWWEDRGAGAMPKGVLPPCGFCAVDAEGEPAGAGWAYFPDGCRVAFLDWFVTRPGQRAGQARAALRAVFASLEAECLARGVVYCFGSTPFAGFAREAQACGFEIVDASTIHLAKTLS